MVQLKEENFVLSRLALSPPTTVELTADGEIAATLSSSISAEGVRMILEAREIGHLQAAMKLAVLLSLDDDVYARKKKKDANGAQEGQDDEGVRHNALGDHLATLGDVETFERERQRQRKDKNSKQLRNWCKRKKLIYYVVERVLQSVEQCHSELKKRKMIGQQHPDALPNSRIFSKNESLLRAAICGYFDQIVECVNPGSTKLSFVRISEIKKSKSTEFETATQPGKEARDRPTLILDKESCLFEVLQERDEAEESESDEENTTGALAAGNSDMEAEPPCSHHLAFLFFSQLLSIQTKRGGVLTIMRGASLIQGTWIEQHAPQQWMARLDFDPKKSSVCRETIRFVGRTVLAQLKDKLPNRDTYPGLMDTKVFWNSAMVRMLGTQEATSTAKEDLRMRIREIRDKLTQDEQTFPTIEVYSKGYKLKFNHGLVLADLQSIGKTRSAHDSGASDPVIMCAGITLPCHALKFSPAAAVSSKRGGNADGDYSRHDGCCFADMEFLKDHYRFRLSQDGRELTLFLNAGLRSDVFEARIRKNALPQGITMVTETSLPKLTFRHCKDSAEDSDAHTEYNTDVSASSLPVATSSGGGGFGKSKTGKKKGKGKGEGKKSSKPVKLKSPPNSAGRKGKGKMKESGVVAFHALENFKSTLELSGALEPYRVDVLQVLMKVYNQGGSLADRSVSVSEELQAIQSELRQSYLFWHTFVTESLARMGVVQTSLALRLHAEQKKKDHWDIFVRLRSSTPPVFEVFGEKADHAKTVLFDALRNLLRPSSVATAYYRPTLLKNAKLHVARLCAVVQEVRCLYPRVRIFIRLESATCRARRGVGGVDTSDGECDMGPSEIKSAACSLDTITKEQSEVLDNDSSSSSDCSSDEAPSLDTARAASSAFVPFRCELERLLALSSDCSSTGAGALTVVLQEVSPCLGRTKQTAATASDLETQEVRKACALVRNRFRLSGSAPALATADTLHQESRPLEEGEPDPKQGHSRRRCVMCGRCTTRSERKDRGRKFEALRASENKQDPRNKPCDALVEPQGYELTLCGCKYCKPCFLQCVMLSIIETGIAKCRRCETDILAKDCRNIICQRGGELQQELDWQLVCDLAVSEHLTRDAEDSRENVIAFSRAAKEDASMGRLSGQSVTVTDNVTCPECNTTSAYLAGPAQRAGLRFVRCRNEAACGSVICTLCNRVVRNKNDVQRCSGGFCSGDTQD
ncbi:unnamed protein product [Amoebophrya sp. A120]|nr:unnamed protein product [Amoebophrya sp. A120]|eukprot:GSA120T00002047001.1